MARITIRRRDENERQDGKAALYAVVNIERKKIRLPLGIAVSSQEWDAEKERVRGRGKEAKDFNLIIDNTKAKITEIMVKSRLTGEKLTRVNFLAMYNRPDDTMNFNEYARQHLQELKNAYQPATLRHHQAALKKLESYAPGLQISDITPEWLQTYASYLRRTFGNNPGTIRKNMCVIRTHYYAAMRAGKTKINPFEVYRLPAADPSVVFLTEEELSTLVALYLEESLEENEQTVLRFFLFMAFTGMHISDARELQIEQIIGGEIQYRRVKTQSLVRVPLCRPAQVIVAYYRGKRMRGYLITGVPTDQAFNRVIKKICVRVGIDKPVSAKAARHTFATIYHKRNNGDLGTLSKLLGHAKIDTTMIYAHIMQEDRRAGVSAFDDMMD